ncbi:MAG: methionine adenosyltransferase [Firmicutes bacterium]|nr:methionine adenosyltransferase [Bacillota bacterium]
MKRLITSESVTEGHPDKVCDAVSDGILDAIISKDKKAKVAAECCVTTGFLLAMGEVTTTAYADVAAIAKKVVSDIGYNNSALGFDASSLAVMSAIHSQSPDIALGVNASKEKKEGNTDRFEEIGAGDQGMMFGYACKETEELMPLPISLAHALTRQLAKVRKDGSLKYLRPDGKSQVTIEYDGSVPKRVDTIIVSAQHDENVSMIKLHDDILKQVIQKTIDKKLLDDKTRILINPTGKFVIGGPYGDSGLTGRKIIADTYGGVASHGGGAFSGKDPTKVDRSAAYMARYTAKNIVSAGLAEKLSLQVCYAIGVSRPVALYIDTFGTSKINEEKLTEIIKKEFDFRVAAIIEKLDLLRPIYSQTSNYGHFGKPDLPWEKLDKVNDLKKYL